MAGLEAQLKKAKSLEEAEGILDGAKGAIDNKEFIAIVRRVALNLGLEVEDIPRGITVKGPGSKESYVLTELHRREIKPGQMREKLRDLRRLAG